ncbi:MAG: hypothetical protein VZR06_02680 [Butyrivibrio sp.]|nr:hypothetical protein [Butyrivibrio sp.]
MNIYSGAFAIDEDLVIIPGYTFESFKKTRYYKNQDGIGIIYLDGMQIINGRKYKVSLFFKNSIIYMLSLICCDEEYSFEDEPERKKLHDEILKNLGVRENNSFNWGKIESSYDRRGNVSSINIIYQSGSNVHHVANTRYYRFYTGDGAVRRIGAKVEYIDQHGNWVEDRALFSMFVGGDSDYYEISKEEADQLVEKRKRKKY